MKKSILPLLLFSLTLVAFVVCSCRERIVGYETVVAKPAKLYPQKSSNYDFGEAIATLEALTPVKITGIQRPTDEQPFTLDPELIKVTIVADCADTKRKGWVYISDLLFESSVLERIIDDLLDREPYAKYVAERIDEIDQAIGMRLVTKVCENAGTEKDPALREEKFQLATAFMRCIQTFDCAASDTTPLHLAARCGDAEFLKTAFDFCEYMAVPIDCAGGSDGNTALLDAAIEGNADSARFLLDRGADMRRANAKGKTAESVMLVSPNAALKNLAAYSRNVEDYASVLAAVAAEDGLPQYNRGYGVQIPLEAGNTHYALAECALRTSRGETVPVRVSEPLEIIGVCDVGIIDFFDSTKYGYYLARNAENVCGVVCGKYLANERYSADDDSGLEFFIVRQRYDAITVSTKMYMKGGVGLACEKIGFAPGEDDIGIMGDDSLNGVVIGEVKARPYAWQGRRLVFAELTCDNPDYELNRMKLFLVIENATAHLALADRYAESHDYDSVISYADCSASWDADDPREITIEHYGEYINDRSLETFEYSHEYTYSRAENDPFAYALTKENHSGEMPEK